MCKTSINFFEGSSNKQSCEKIEVSVKKLGFVNAMEERQEMKMKAKLSRTLKKRLMVDVAPHVDDDEDSGGSNCFICGYEDYFEN